MQTRDGAVTEKRLNLTEFLALPSKNALDYIDYLLQEDNSDAVCFAISLKKQNPDPILTASINERLFQAYRNLAFFYFEQKSYDKAASFIQNAEIILEQIDKDLGSREYYIICTSVYLELASQALDAEHYDISQELLEIAEEFIPYTEDWQSELRDNTNFIYAQIFYAVGNIEFEQENYDDALESFEGCFEELDGLTNTRNRAELYKNCIEKLIYIYCQQLFSTMRQNETQTATALLEKANHLYNILPDSLLPEMHSSPYFILVLANAKYALHTNKIDKAQEYYEWMKNSKSIDPDLYFELAKFYYDYSKILSKDGLVAAADPFDLAMKYTQKHLQKNLHDFLGHKLLLEMEYEHLGRVSKYNKSEAAHKVIHLYQIALTLASNPSEEKQLADFYQKLKSYIQTNNIHIPQRTDRTTMGLDKINTSPLRQSTIFNQPSNRPKISKPSHPTKPTQGQDHQTLKTPSSSQAQQPQFLRGGADIDTQKPPKENIIPPRNTR